MEAIYGYVSGTPWEGGRGQRDAAGERQRDGKTELGGKETNVGDMRRGKNEEKGEDMERDVGENGGKGRGWKEEKERTRLNVGKEERKIGEMRKTKGERNCDHPRQPYPALRLPRATLEKEELSRATQKTHSRG